ncbi:metal-dependent hydrolase [Methanosarcina sp.]|uniref:metal-dependent hydrolase n=1 Tax=Methanosarcina sp. TaxID=2213 RepID=UPI002AB8D541|nr:metal-dependent hydrolase [Methanosarcina sp.]MDY9927225.1 metal-dependent hydrolase [Methanosarcina sp.]
MFIFGHIGITLGIFYFLNRLFPEKNIPVDFKWIAFGALLPDFIDKPLGRIILAETIGSGRIFAHTLLFAILLGILAGYTFYRKGWTIPLIVAGASFCHLLEDQMWNSPRAFLWPLLGWEFPRDIFLGGFIEYFMRILTNSYNPASSSVFIPEIIGLGIILLFAGSYIRSKLEGKKYHSKVMKEEAKEQ